MKTRETINTTLCALILVLALGLLLLGECAYGGGMGAAYKTCQCLGYEWLFYDQTPVDGPRKTVCVGFVRSYQCYQLMSGPPIPCPQ